MSFVEAYVFISPDGSTWTDVAGHGASVAVSGGERATGEAHTMDGDTPILKAGKRASLDITVRFVYTETASDPFDIAQTAYETAGGALYCQYRALNGGNWFSTGAGIITSLLYPGGETGDGSVVMSEFVIKCATITDASAST
jgi:hypothetical protein